MSQYALPLVDTTRTHYMAPTMALACGADCLAPAERFAFTPERVTCDDCKEISA